LLKRKSSLGSLRSEKDYTSVRMSERADEEVSGTYICIYT